MRYYGFKKAKNTKIHEYHEAFPPANMLALAALNRNGYSRKLIMMPAATADPITPATFGAMACTIR
jgi:hypothetical protein